MTPSIRPATKADIAALDALLASSYGRQLAAAYPPSLMVTAVPLLARAQPALIASGRYYVAELEGRIVGAGGWSLRRQGHGEVRHVVTHAALARRGIGRMLLGHVADRARAEGAVRLDCLATLNAEPFYAALGFERIGPVTIPLAPGIDFPAVRMVKRLG